MVNKVGAISNLRLENQLTKLTSLVRQFAIGQHQPVIAARVCGICTFMEHPTDMCPALQETESDHLESVGSIGIPTATVPTAATIESATTRQLTIFRGPDKAVGYKKPGVLANYELEQHAISTTFKCHNPRPQNASGLASEHYESSTIGWVRKPSFTNNSKSDRECKELPQTAPQQKPRPTDVEFEPEVDSPFPKPVGSLPLSFPNQTLSARKSEIDEDLLKMFRKIPKYAKFLKELCVHKRGKMKRKGGVELNGIVSALTKNKAAAGSHQNLPKKSQDPKIFFVPCTIGECTFADAMLDLGASINVMSTPVYKSLNFGALEPTRMIIQLANRSIVQPLGVIEDVLVQVNELIFPADLYVLDMEDETSRKGSTLILG
ncbi:hypothetical protein CR513_59843, partial [Mucuna pruriens]